MQGEGSDGDRDSREFAPTVADGPGGPAAAGWEGLERYSDLVEIGRGGMGRVLRGLDRQLDRPVAIKILARSTHNQSMRDKFLLEARISGNLEHPGIVPVHEVGRTPGGLDYFTMRLVRGRSLAEVLADRGRPPWTALLPAFVKICEAVAYAHSQRVVHRDLKPGNVMVGDHGEVLVVDWGLARVLDDPDVARTRPTGALRLSTLAADRERTQDGAILGTPAFMAPEQATGSIDSIDERTDVYGLGTILYQILTGQAPFSGATAADVLAAVEAGAFPLPSALRPDLPRELDAVVARAMARRPGDRYPGVEELRTDVEAFLEGRVLAAVDYGLIERAGRWLRGHRQTARLLGVALVAGLVVAGGGFVVLRAEEQRQLAEAHAELRARTEIERGRRFLSEMERQRGLPPGPGIGLEELAAEASRAFDRALARVPDHHEALHGLGRARFLAGDADGALGWFDRSIEARPDWAPARADRIRVHLPLLLEEHFRDRSLGRTENAGIEHWRRQMIDADVAALRQLAGENWEERFAAAIFSLIEGRGEEAATAIEEYLTHFPNDVEALVIAGRALSNLGRHEEAVARFERAIATDVRRADLAMALAWAENLCGRPGKGVAACDRFLDHERTPDLLTTRGVLRSAVGRIEEAGEDFEEAIALDPSHHGAHIGRALVLKTLGRTEESLAAIEAGLVHHPSSIQLLVQRARLWRMKGRGDLVEADLARILESHPTDASAHFQVGFVHDEVGDRATALAFYRSAIALLDLPLYRHHQGIARLLLGDPDGAAEHDAAVDALPSLVSYCRTSAQARAERGDLAGAEAECDAVLRRTADDLEMLGRRSKVRFQRGDLDGAIADLERVLVVAPLDWPRRPDVERTLGKIRERR